MKKRRGTMNRDEKTTDYPASEPRLDSSHVRA